MMAPSESTSAREARFSEILSRLQEIPNYSWDTSIDPFHSVSSLRH